MPKAIQFELLLFLQCPHYLLRFRQVPAEGEYTQKRTFTQMDSLDINYLKIFMKFKLRYFGCDSEVTTSKDPH